VRRETVVGERLPFDKVRYRQFLAREEADFRLELIGVPGIGGEDQDGSIRVFGELQRGQRRTGANQAAPSDRPAGVRYCYER